MPYRTVWYAPARPRSKGGEDAKDTEVFRAVTPFLLATPALPLAPAAPAALVTAVALPVLGLVDMVRAPGGHGAHGDLT
jgi:hypothetical protein